MGTRSLTKIFDGDTLLITIYCQYDGYMAGHGRKLAGLLEGKPVVNGFGDRNQAAFNGPGCMAAAIIAGLKEGIGNVYIQAPGDNDDMVDYVYEIHNTEEGDGFAMKYTQPRIKVTSYGEPVFEGDVAAFVEAAMQPEEY